MGGVRADIFFASNSTNNMHTGAGTNYIVKTPSGVLYLFYIDVNVDVAYRKSTDGGFTWSISPVIVFTGTVIGLSVWYDRWSGINADLIHLAYTETTGHDTLYRTVNAASSDALSTQTTIFNGVSGAQSGSYLSITRARGGNVYCKTQIDAGVEGGFFRLPNANVPNGAWDAARTIDEAVATLDMMILVPGFAADNQDIMAIFWDASANEVSRKIYDDSANTWAETSIATSMVEIAPGTAFPNFAAAVDLTNSQIYLIAWNGIDTANQDLQCWTVTESAITAKTDVVTNGVDDQGLAALALDTETGYLYAFYAGKSDGSETWPTSLNIYCKGSTDSGGTWSPETLMTPSISLGGKTWLTTTNNFTGERVFAFFTATNNEVKVNVPIIAPRATVQIGI